MSWVLAGFVVVAFAATIAQLALPARAREVGARTARCLEVLRDPSLDDDAKERTLRSQSVRLFGLLAILSGGSALALGLPLLTVWLLDRAGAASFGGVLSVLQRGDFLLATVAVGFLAYLGVRVARSR